MKILDTTFTQEQQDVIVGTMLGDSKLVFSQFDRASFACEQSQTHKDYLYSLFEIFKNHCAMTEPTKYSKFDKRYNKTYISYYFSTPVMEALGVYADLFYVLKPEGGKLKIVPQAIMGLLTPRALAY
jgi:hypothetical protein